MNAARLLKLAEHLETGELGGGEWDFESSVKKDGHGDYYQRLKKERQAGRTCVIDECEFLWPDEFWHVSNSYGGPSGYYDAVRFFDVHPIDITALFVPGHDNLHKMPKPSYIITQLPPTSTRHEVAARIRKFVEWKRNAA